MHEHNQPPSRVSERGVRAVKRKHESTIYMLPPKDFRQSWCDICHAMTEIRFRDCATGQVTGHCCLRDLINADALLEMDQTIGLRRPALNEAKLLTQ